MSSVKTQASSGRREACRRVVTNVGQTSDCDLRPAGDAELCHQVMAMHGRYRRRRRADWRSGMHDRSGPHFGYWWWSRCGTTRTVDSPGRRVKMQVRVALRSEYSSTEQQELQWQPSSRISKDKSSRSRLPLKVASGEIIATARDTTPKRAPRTAFTAGRIPRPLPHYRKAITRFPD
jgi:hypothetical protein